MSPRLRSYWSALNSSFWFLPTVMTLSAIALSFITAAIDDRLEPDVNDTWWLFAGRAEGARAMLMTIAGSMITVAGLAFSIMVVALTLASQQYGPRLLRGFMRDTANQIVLGTFIATFVYSLLILRTVRASAEGDFVPQVSVVVAVLLTLGSVGVLIFFLHHAATSMRSVSVIAAAGRDLDAAAERTFTELIGSAREGDDGAADPGELLPDEFEERAAPVPSAGAGYLQAIDAENILETATELDLLIRIEARPGHHMLPNRPLARAWPVERIDSSVVAELNRAFILGDERTAEQDVEFAIEELVEIAVRALSPGVNDPFTAIRCIDRLTASLDRLAARHDTSPFRYDRAGELRVVAYPQSFATLVPTAFNRIRQSGVRDVAVAIRLLESLTQLAASVRDEDGRRALVRQATLLVEEIENAGLHPTDVQDIRERERRLVVAALDSAAIQSVVD